MKPQADRTVVNPFSPGKFMNIYLLLTISIQNRSFRFENMGIDHTLPAIHYEKKNSPKLFLRNVWPWLGEFGNTSFVVIGAEMVKKGFSRWTKCPHWYWRYERNLTGDKCHLHCRCHCCNGRCRCLCSICRPPWNCAASLSCWSWVAGFGHVGWESLTSCTSPGTSCNDH